jgi:hypothetical protein
MVVPEVLHLRSSICESGVSLQFKVPMNKPADTGPLRLTQLAHGGG